MTSAEKFDRYIILRSLIVLDEVYSKEISLNPTYKTEEKHKIMQQNYVITQGVIDRLLDKE